MVYKSLPPLEFPMTLYEKSVDILELYIAGGIPLCAKFNSCFCTILEYSWSSKDTTTANYRTNNEAQEHQHNTWNKSNKYDYSTNN